MKVRSSQKLMFFLAILTLQSALLSSQAVASDRCANLQASVRQGFQVALMLTATDLSDATRKEDRILHFRVVTSPISNDCAAIEGQDRGFFLNSEAEIVTPVGRYPSTFGSSGVMFVTSQGNTDSTRIHRSTLYAHTSVINRICREAGFDSCEAVYDGGAFGPFRLLVQLASGYKGEVPYSQDNHGSLFGHGLLQDRPVQLSLKWVDVQFAAP